MKLTKEQKEIAKKTIQLRNDITKKIAELDKLTKNKNESDLKELIKNCKLFEKYTNTLKDLGYKVEIWHKRLDYRNWELMLNEKTSIKSVTKTKTKKAAKSKKAENKKHIIQKAENQNSDILYYIMLCWTTRQDYCICDNAVNAIKKYFEKMKLEFMDTMVDSFPDRIEYTSTYKIKTTPEVYKTIIDSAEYILDISTSNVHEKCNIGVFGKKI